MRQLVPVAPAIRDSPDPPARIGPFRVLALICPCTHGSVYRAVHVASGHQAAVKRLLRCQLDADALRRCRREVAVMRTLCHENIASYYDCHETEESFDIVCEYCSNGDLKTAIRKSAGLSEAEARGYFSQILSAVHYCHQNNVMHRDIKPENILLNRHNQIKLIDFGLSNFIRTRAGSLFHRSFCGTPAYSAPEIINSRPYFGPAVDVWSLGVLLFVMHVCEFPFRVVADIPTVNYQMPSTFSAELRDLIQRIFVLDPGRRITVEQMLQHPWLRAAR